LRDHPHIAAVYGLHEAGGLRFITMELVAGEDLEQRLARGTMSVPEALELRDRSLRRSKRSTRTAAGRKDYPDFRKTSVRDWALCQPRSPHPNDQN